MLQISDLRRQAKAGLQGLSYDPKKLVLIHTAIALGCSLVVAVLTYLCDLFIADTGGLSGLQIRSVLTTIQSVLDRAVTFCLPFWQVGLFYVALQWTKGQSAGFGDLLQGFRKFGSTLGLLFLRGGLFAVLAFPVFYISSAIFLLTPFATPLLELFAPMMEQGVTPEQLEELLNSEAMATASQNAIPLLVIFGILYAAITIPIFYRIRFASYALMDGMTAGKALLKSFTITKKKFLQVLKIDLAYWWFYLVQFVSVAISSVALVYIYLPETIVFLAFVFYVLGILCQTALLWQAEAQRVTVYALAYRTLDGTMGADTTDSEC